MNQTAHEAYLSNQVHTATPQKLRLMLIEGSMRFVLEAKEYWESDVERSRIAVSRCRECITELLGSVRPKIQPELTHRVSSVYLFLFRTLTELQLHNAPERLDDVYKVLEVERETWRLVCEQMPEAPSAEVLEQVKPREITASNHEAIAPPTSPALNNHTNGVPTPVSRGFSLDA